MSIKLMSLVWELDLTAVEKLVLLALADCANDEGLAWPSIATIRRKANVGERTVQRSLRSLEDQGLLERNEVIGKGCKYIIHPRHSGTPATVAPPPHRRDTPATVAPKPSRTINTIKRRAMALPDGWKPEPFTAGSKCAGIIATWPAGELETQAEHFAASHTAKGNLFSDWQAAWKTWVLNSRNFGGRSIAKPANDPADFLAHLTAKRGP